MILGIVLGSIVFVALSRGVSALLGLTFWQGTAIVTIANCIFALAVLRWADRQEINSGGEND